MKEGLALYSLSESGKNEVDSPSTIYTATESLILRNFELSGFTFHVELMQKIKVNLTSASEEGAKGDGNVADPTLEYLKPVLKECFRQKKYCLLSSGTFYVMMWRTKEAYFVFDACGRRLNDFKTDKEHGVAMLICLSTLENVRHLIANLSNLNATDTFVIRELKVVKVVTPEGSIMQRDYMTRTHQYEIVNDDYAYLKAGLHLSLNRNDLLRNRSGLPVAVAAITSSTIDHPATWDMKMADRIICFGVSFCQNFWGQCNVNETIDVKEFPTFFKIGQFHVTSDLLDKKYEGTWRCVPGFKDSDLANSIKTAFEAGHNKLIVQINYQMYAVWKKNDFIYLFDPYRHRIVGKANESDVYDEMEKSATVRMFRDFEVFMNVFNHILLDSNRTSRFYIHVMKVKNIQFGRKHDGILKLSEIAKLDDKGEVMSINEHICFEENEQICQKALGEISDYEDEDLASDVVEMELRTSSSEPELLEEEEAGLGAIEELEGLESSSSGEEGGGHKKKGGKSKGAGAGAGADTKGKGKSKNSKKGGGKKGKKGKGPGDKDIGGKKRKTGDEDDEGASTDDEGLTAKKDKKPQGEGGKKKGKRRKGDTDEDKKKAQQEKENLGKDSEKEGIDEDINIIIDKKREKYKRESSKEASKHSGKEGGKEDGKVGERDSSKEDDKEGTKDSSKEGSKLVGKDDRNKEKGKDKDKTIKEGNEDDFGKGKDKVTDKKIENKDKDGKEDGKQNAFEHRDINKITDKQIEDKDKDDKEGGKDKSKNLEKDSATKDKLDTKENDKDYDKLLMNDTEIYKNKQREKFKNEDETEGKNKEEKIKGQDKDKEEQDKRIEEQKDKDTEKSNDEEKGGDKNKEKVKNIERDSDKDKDKEKSKYKDKNIIKNKENEQEKVQKLKNKPTDDGTEADDENEDCFIKKCIRYCLPKPSRSPGYLVYPADMAVVGSESGSYESLCKLFQSGFKIADRILSMTPWGNFVIFRCKNDKCPNERNYFLYDGCTCNFNYFRHMDLNVGTAGLVRFEHLHNVIEHIRSLRKCRKTQKSHMEQRPTADDICKVYCKRNSYMRL